jgi:hypothetical protein
MPIETTVKSRVQLFWRFNVVFARHHVLDDVGVLFVYTLKGKFGETIGHLVFARRYYLVILRCESDATKHSNRQTHGFDFHEESYFLGIVKRRIRAAYVGCNTRVTRGAGDEQKELMNEQIN